MTLIIQLVKSAGFAVDVEKYKFYQIVYTIERSKIGN
jgi:hypothetical protein